MELRHLRYFEVVGKTLNFTRAAEQLHIAQPPLSRQIREIEEELGTELIDRSSRPIALTKAGTFFLEQCVQILSRLDEAKEGTRRIGQGKKRWFGIGFVPSVLYGFLPELIREYRSASNDIEVVFSELTTIQQAEALKAGRIDVGFGRLLLEDPEIRCDVFEEEPLVAALPVGHPLARKQRIALGQIASEPFIIYPAKPRPSYADHVLNIFRAHGLKLNVAVEANEMQTAIGFVAAGIGSTLVPDSVQRLKRDDVVYRPLAGTAATSPVIMNVRSGDTSPELARFMGFAEKYRPAARRE
ncbi:LysR family transcriptional regulator [Noviherbaspirillum malthae]|uniref:LysR family transcriptional regulator n=1 Tax=Noviherbaspirillum malthae TaxID=1260987 RepID=UPI00188DCAAC|nr:LysR family transcriptional regulator [Noviherbaspirillum malthae]